MTKRKSALIVYSLIIVMSFSLVGKTNAQPLKNVIVSDGIWSWVSDPRAIYLPQGDGYVLTGYITEEGSVASLLVSLKNRQIQQTILNKNMEVDDHNNPTFVSSNDSTVIVFNTKHHKDYLFMNKLEVKEGRMRWLSGDTIDPNGKADLKRFGDDHYTFANPCRLSGENNRLYLFGRWVGAKPNITWSDDEGKTWADSRVLIARKPYKRSKQTPTVKYYSDGKDKIHIIFTDGHPRNEAKNSVYYACYSKGAFYKADGKLICTIDQLPFQPKDATLVYDAKKTKHRAWIFDVVADSLGNPAVAYARYPSEKEHIYHYAWYDGKTWNDREVVNSGKWFPDTPAGEIQREPHYSGGMSIDPNHPHTLYISREVKSVFEIEKWIFQPEKSSWTKSPVTQNSISNQVRPYVVKNTPANVGSIVLWNSIEKYLHFTNFQSKIKMVVEK